MHIMYVDESGDPGFHRHASKHYILSSLIISQTDWAKCLTRLKALRKAIKTTYGLNQREEIHASELIRVKELKNYKLINKSNRIRLLKYYTSQIPIIFDSAKVINIALKKSDYAPTTDLQLLSWGRLIERYDMYLKKMPHDKGIIISDDTDGLKVMSLLRKMRVYNPVASHFSASSYNAPTDSIIEDVFSRASNHSYFIQTVDVISHMLYRSEYPKGSLKKFSLEKQFAVLDPILLKEAAKADKMGIVRK